MKVRGQATIDLSNLDNAVRIRIRLKLLKKGSDKLAVFEEMLLREKIKKHSHE